MNDIEIAAYLDRGLPEAERNRIEGHLAECGPCRAEVLEAQEFVGRVRPRRRLIVFGALAAAAAAILFIAPATLRSRAGDESLMRAESATPTLVAHGPAGDVALQGLRFVWASAPGAMTYRITLSRADGTQIWTMSSSDTAVTLPDSIELRPAERYLWITDALLSDGTTRSTGFREFGRVP